MLEERRKRLYEIYKVWETELKSICPQIIAEGYSYPYYLHIPDNWFDSNIRIMIVGEEGAGEKRYDETMETAQQFNKEYLQSQLDHGDDNYGKNCSQFWHRFRKIASLPGVSVVWNNLDKIHISRKGNGKLKMKDRKALHKTPTKILQEEIVLLEPTHVIFFGWYGISLQCECPHVFDKLYPGGPKDYSVWQSEKMASLSVAGIHYIFTYHPGWRQKGKDYEDKVLKIVERALEKNTTE